MFCQAPLLSLGTLSADINGIPNGPCRMPARLPPLPGRNTVRHERAVIAEGARHPRIARLRRA